MIRITVSAKNTIDALQQIRDAIGGQISERWGEYILEVNNKNAKGSIRSIVFDWGMSVVEYDLTFYDDVYLESESSEFNPINFVYCLEGTCEHRFGFQDEAAKKDLEQYQSVIISGRDGGYNCVSFPKGKKLLINIVKVMRKPFLRKRLNNGESLNKRLHEVFMDTDHENVFAYYGMYNLKMADKVSALRKVRAKGMIRIILTEGLVYQILAMHIEQHNRDMAKNPLPDTLLKREVKIIRDYSKHIEKNFSKAFSLESIALDTGLTQAKLQKGFKFLYNKTVTEYIRHVRLEVARDFMNTTDMNISEIVYSIGFTSRSYFSKIFKEKYGLSPTEFKRKQSQLIVAA